MVERASCSSLSQQLVSPSCIHVRVQVDYRQSLQQYPRSRSRSLLLISNCPFPCMARLGLCSWWACQILTIYCQIYCEPSTKFLGYMSKGESFAQTPFSRVWSGSQTRLLKQSRRYITHGLVTDEVQSHRCCIEEIGPFDCRLFMDRSTLLSMVQQPSRLHCVSFWHDARTHKILMSRK